MISGAAMIGGLVGRPIGLSLSPLIHHAWIDALGLDAAYVPFELVDDGFEPFIGGLRRTRVKGVNVTQPFKGRALAAADAADDAARAADAANLLLFRDDGGLEARNTDGLGLLAALRTQAPQLTLDGAHLVLIGAGGGAQGGAAALLQAGAATLHIVNRTHARAATMAERLSVRASAETWERLPELLEDADLVVNATSAGMGGAAPLDVPWPAAGRGCVAMDMVYRPLQTSFLAGAQTCGLAVVDGLEMLIGQARPTFEALFGRPPPEGVDVRALALETMETAA